MAAAATSKRKRDLHDAPGGRAAPALNPAPSDFDTSYLEAGDDNDGVMDFTSLDHHGTDVADPAAEHIHSPVQRTGGPAGNTSNTDTAAAAMAQYHTMTVPQSTEQAFMQGAEGSVDKPLIGSDLSNPGSANFAAGGPRGGHSFAEFVQGGDPESPEEDGSPRRESMSQMMGRGTKPSVGSEEWHKQRRDNHKEVERRRREAINEGISELSKIVPGCEKNKGSILSRAVQFITQLKDNESQNIEKWTLEKLLTEQAIAELSSSCDKLKAECQRAWSECEAWKAAAEKAGVSAADVDVAAHSSSSSVGAAGNLAGGGGGGGDGKVDADGEDAD